MSLLQVDYRTIDSDPPISDGPLNEEVLPIKVDENVPSGDLSEEELSERVLEAIVTARRVASNLGIDVQLGERGAGSYCSLRFGARKIVLDPRHIEESPATAVFVPAHEGAHAAISIGPAALGQSTEKAVEFGKKIGFHFLHNCQEDGSVNTWTLNKFPGIEAALREVYDPDLLPENPEMATPETSQIIALIGKYPRFAQFGSEILKIWYTGEPSVNLDPEVRLAIDRTRIVFEQAINEIPGSDISDRNEVLRKARTRWHLMTDHVWPEMERLVQLDLDDEKLKAILKKLSDLMEGQLAGSNGPNGVQIPGQGAPGGVPGQPQGGSGGSGGISLPFSPEQIARLQDTFDQAIKKRAEALAREYQERGEPVPSQEELEAYLRAQVQEGQGIGVPIASLPPALSKAIDQYKKSLSPEEVAELEAQSRKNLEDLEDTLNEQLESKFNEDRAPTHAELREYQEKATEELQRVAREITVEKEILDQLKEDRHRSLTDYEKILGEVQSKIDDAFCRLNNILIPQEAPLAEAGFSSGFRVNIGRYMQSRADPAYLDVMWEKRPTATERTHAFKLIVDVSGSMKEASKDKESQRGAVFLAELLSRLVVPVSIDAFNDSILELKDFDTPLAASSARTHIGGLIRLGGGGTLDATAIAKGYREIKELRAEHKYIIILTDAQSGQAAELKNLTRKIREDGEVVLIHFGIGAGTADTSGSYQFSFGDLTTDGSKRGADFFATFCRVIETTITEPWQFAPVRSGDYRRLGLVRQMLLRMNAKRGS